MGIHGIYKEIGPGRRVALSKLALEKFEETGRPLRIAIDTSIWLFQIQASKGGTNPALRTFYYRLLRLINLSIHPIFVFDGPNKPPFKRNKRTGPNVASIPEFLAKQLLKQFGFPIHLAPGEAEAECALLQREGIVDAVLSEDVDTLMFGSAITIRNWSPEKSGKTPTHVNVFDSVETRNGASGLDREGMILVALMSGGDYVPEGIPGCGPKIACEAARAGFGTDLCKIPRGNAAAYTAWRERLQHELKTNESKFFKSKHGALKIPNDFPRLDILGYYTHPAISNSAGLDKLREAIHWDQELDYPGLRDFASDAFDWVKLEGAKHFVRSLAPALLVRSLRMRATRLGRLPTSDLRALQEDEALLIKGIHGKRQHPITDNSTELRVSFMPIDLVKIDLSKEEPDDEPESAPVSTRAGEVDVDDDFPLDPEDDGPKKRGPTKFDPCTPVRVWVLESFVKVGIPLKVQDWEAERQIKLKPSKAATSQDARNAAAEPKTAARKTKAKNDTSQRPIGLFTKVTKPGVRAARAPSKAKEGTSGPISTSTQQRPQPEVVNLLSSPPEANRSLNLVPEPTRERSPSPVLAELPPSVTKRRKRAPMQRAHTIATSSLAADTIETLNLVDSPPPWPTRGNSTNTTRNAELVPIARTTRGSSVASPQRTRQTTLDLWRASATPTKSRDPARAAYGPPVPLDLRPVMEDVETLDLTMSSPQRPLVSRAPDAPPANPRRTSPKPTARRPLTSRSSNISSRSASSSSSSTKTKTKTKKTAKDIFTASQPRRTSPRLQKTVSVPPVFDDEDRTDDLEILDLTGFSSPVPHRAPLPQPHATTAIEPPDFLAPTHTTTATNSALRKVSTGTKPRAKKDRYIVLREDQPGVWGFVEFDGLDMYAAESGKDHDAPNGKRQRMWKESEIEVLDLT
ncbi:hypothetical protein IQ07DRAFT_366739 [Pyrenochaeta sp. DS3sAY3a]|nr:hypothetical protein IQ07DRAFT_366739 [Pyrenochaeta sp. DS3sAY3a]